MWSQLDKMLPLILVISSLLRIDLACSREIMSTYGRVVLRTGLRISYTPIEVQDVKSLLECVSLCSRNRCCLSAFLEDTGKEMSICTLIDIHADNFLISNEHSVYLALPFEKGENPKWFLVQTKNDTILPWNHSKIEILHYWYSIRQGKWDGPKQLDLSTSRSKW